MINFINDWIKKWSIIQSPDEEAIYGTGTHYHEPNQFITKVSYFMKTLWKNNNKHLLIACCMYCFLKHHKPWKHFAWQQILFIILLGFKGWFSLAMELES